MANENPHEKFAYLDQLSTEELEELIRADIDSPENQNAEAVFHILEVLNSRAKKDPDGVAFDQEQVWHDIQTIYNVPEGKGCSLYPVDGEADEDGDGLSGESHVVPFDTKPTAKKRPRLKWGLSVAAAAIIIFSCMMVGAQASGIDVFGFLAQWTADVFSYKTDSEFYPMIRDAFVQNHFPTELAAKWYPDGFVASEPEVFEAGFSTVLHIEFNSHAENKYFTISIRRYFSSEDLAILEHQRDLDFQEQYTSGNKTFFIVSNEGYTTATWSDRETYVMSIIGDISVQDTEKIIDSMGG